MRTIRTIIILLAALLLAWLLPWCYNFICSSPSESPLTLYSCVTHDFVTFSFEGKDDTAGYDLAGNSFDEKQFDSIMPTFFYRRLAEDDRLPAQIDGIGFDLHEVERSNFVFRSSPSDLNRPCTGLYQLLDAAPGREGFRTPDDVFRITHTGIEFVKMEGNCIDIPKSERFTRVMTDKGFVFPARAVAGNASTRKVYDNGYLLIDAAGVPFQLKQLHGRPFVRRIEQPDSVVFTHAFVTEFPDKRLLGFLGNDRGDIHALEADYSLHRLPLRPVDLRRERLIIVGDHFYWTAIIERQGFERLTAVNARDYSLAAEHETDFPAAKWEQARKYLFPFRLVFTASSDKYVKPRFHDFSYLALGLNLLLAIGWAVYSRKRRRCRAVRILGILVLGIYLLVPLLLTSRE